MKINLTINHKTYQANLSQEKSLAITLLPNDSQPNHFAAPASTSEVLMAGDFIGDTEQGGSCNVNRLTIIPHCNGTHTESVSHIIDEIFPVFEVIEKSLFACHLISLTPINGENNLDCYSAGINSDNLVITKKQLCDKLTAIDQKQLEGLIIRTLPNTPTKKNCVYDNDNYPPFLTNGAMEYLVEKGIKHLLVDFPSVDKMYDDGLLENHRIFWNVNTGETKTNPRTKIKKTITEMVYINDDIQDGFYLCNLQVPEIKTDAVPSRPILFSLREITD